MKIFISQPMNGRTNEEIMVERSLAIAELSKKIEVSLIDTLFDLENKPPLYYLGKSIEAMADADLVVFIGNWENARGCRIEYETAREYNKNILILSGD